MHSSIRSWYSCCSCFRFWTEMESHRRILSPWVPLPGVVPLLPTPEVTVALKLVFIITVYVLCCYHIWLDHGFKWQVLYECHIKCHLDHSAACFFLFNNVLQVRSFQEKIDLVFFFFLVTCIPLNMGFVLCI